MIDREKVLTVLRKRFPGAAPDQVAAAANAIVGLGDEDEWEEVTDRTPEMGYNFSIQCGEICYLADEMQRGGQFRIFKKKTPASS